jgi:hypothetical protein
MCYVYKNFLISFSHIGCILNNIAFIVWPCTPMGSLEFGSLNNAFATKWVYYDLYTIVNSYFQKSYDQILQFS